MNTLKHMRSSTHELRWWSVVLVQLPGLSVFAITRLGQSHRKPNFLRSVLTSFYLNSLPACHWCVHFVFVPRAFHCIFHKGLWKLFGDNKESAQPCRAQRSLRLPPAGEDTVPWERSLYLTHAWLLCCNETVPNFETTKTSITADYEIFWHLSSLLLWNRNLLACNISPFPKFKRVYLPHIKFKISKHKMPDVDD